MKFSTPLIHGWKCRITALLLNQSVERRQGFESKYALNPAARVVAGNLTGSLPAGVRCSLRMRYEEMLEGDERIPVTISCLKSVKSVKTVLSVRNAFNEQYEEFPGLRAPGRWYTLRLEYSLLR